MNTSPHVYAALAAQRQSAIRDEVATLRLARRLRADRRLKRRAARGALWAAEIEVAASQRPRVVGRPSVAR